MDEILFFEVYAEQFERLLGLFVELKVILSFLLHRADSSVLLDNLG